MSAEIEMFCAQRIPWAELCDARRDQSAEENIVARLIDEKPNRFSDDSIKTAVHHIVHVAKHYTVTDRPAS